MKPPFKKLVVIGMGLIGSSIARSAHAHKVASVIIGVDSNELSLIYARKHGFVTDTTTDAAKAVVDSDVVIIATPTHLLAEICEAIAPYLAEGALVMDTGSVKQLPLSLMSEHLPAHVLVVPAHPIAGSEQSGVAAGSEQLFDKKRVVITPEIPLEQDALQHITQFWQLLGARVEAMPAELHDTIYGYVSHLPQLLAFAVLPLIHPTDDEIGQYPALNTFLRISASDIQLWSGIFLLNREVMLAASHRYLDVISHIRKELENAPEGTERKQGSVARLALFPRIVASCLITTVMEAEKNAGVHFVRYAGSGFADFTHPVMSDPEQDLAHISDYYAELIPLMEALEARLSGIIRALESESASSIAGSLE